ncbi:MAG: AraC family transcriptional regulator [Lachnospiraceae bacterium]|nr:AraC family transcriptional regulator [Lachnospiraceae bacterium]
MYLELKENIPHGTKECPYDQYFMHNAPHAFQIPVHWHDELEIIYIKQGTLKISIDEQLYNAVPGSVYFVNPKELHLMGTEDLNAAYYTLLFPLEFISFQSDDQLETTLLHPLRNGSLQFSHEIHDTSRNKKAAAILEQVIARHPCHNIARHLQIRCLLLQLLVMLLEDETFFRKVEHGTPTTFQRELLIFIQSHYSEPLSLAMLAKHFHLSEKYISRYFKEHFHISLIQYLNHQRLIQAKKLLETTELPVTEIALCCGFNNVSYFIRTFKKAYGMSPLRYRRKR